MKIFDMCAAFAAMTALCSCNGLVDDEGSGNGHVASGDLSLTVSATVIQANGEDEAKFEVLYLGEPVTEGVTIYDGNNNVVDLPSLTFTAAEPGSYSFWAAYGTAYSETVTVTAIDFPVPVLPEDPDPDNLSFSRRVMLTQFTGTGCASLQFRRSCLSFFGKSGRCDGGVELPFSGNRHEHSVYQLHFTARAEESD